MKQILDWCQSAIEYLIADELAAKCDGNLSAKRVARYILMLNDAGYVFNTWKRSLGDRAAVNEYRLISEEGVR